MQRSFIDRALGIWRTTVGHVFSPHPIPLWSQQHAALHGRLHVAVLPSRIIGVTLLESSSLHGAKIALLCHVCFCSNFVLCVWDGLDTICTSQAPPKVSGWSLHLNEGNVGEIKRRPTMKCAHIWGTLV